MFPNLNKKNNKKKLIIVTITSKNDFKNAYQALKSVSQQKGVSTLIIANVFLLKKRELKKIKRMVDIYLPKKTKIAEGRNLVLYYALKYNPKYVIMINSDIVLPPYWIKTAVNLMEKHKKLGALGGIQEVEKGLLNTIISLLLRVPTKEILSSQNEIIKVTNVPCEAVIYRTRALTKLLENDGFIFNEKLTAGEDPELSQRLRNHGYSLALSPLLCFKHKMKTNISSFWKQQILYGKGYYDWKFFSSTHVKTEFLYCLFFPKSLFKKENLIKLICLLLLYYFLFFIKLVANLYGFFIRSLEIKMKTNRSKFRAKNLYSMI